MSFNRRGMINVIMEGFLVKRHSLKRALYAGALVCSSLFYYPLVSEAATFDGLSITLNTDGGTCASSRWDITFAATATLADVGSSNDEWGFFAFDGNGVPISATWSGIGVGSDSRTTFFGIGSQINAMTARPLTIVFVDTLNDSLPGGGNTIAQFDALKNAFDSGDPVLNTLVYDVADDVADCANLPFVGSETAAIPTMSIYGLMLTTLGLLLVAIRRLRPSAKRG